MMNTRVEMNKEMMKQVNGGARNLFVGNPYSPNALKFPMDEKDEKKCSTAKI